MKQLIKIVAIIGAVATLSACGEKKIDIGLSCTATETFTSTPFHNRTGTEIHRKPIVKKVVFDGAIFKNSVQSVAVFGKYANARASNVFIGDDVVSGQITIVGERSDNFKSTTNFSYNRKTGAFELTDISDFNAGEYSYSGELLVSGTCVIKK